MPRDPKRIPDILATLEKVWVAHPDWRLGQLIANAGRDRRGSVSGEVLFNIEDELLARRIEQLYHA